jgi:hypothetical protein
MRRKPSYAHEVTAGGGTVNNGRRWRLVALGVLMSALSVLILMIGINDPDNGLLLDIAGGFSTLFCVPLTLFLIYGAIRLAPGSSALPAPVPNQSGVDMALFGRKYRSDDTAGLLTCMVSAEDDEWSISWLSDNTNKEPPEFEAASLTEAVDQAGTAALALWSTRFLIPGAQLDFAIYPWRYGKNGAIYDISGVPGGYTARDIVGSDREVQAPSLEGLVEAISHEPGGDVAMLRWVRPFAELPTAGLEE